MAATKSFPRSVCKLAIEKGKFFLYMPNGEKIPEQVDCTVEVEQTLDMAFNGGKPVARAKITVLAELLDTVQMEPKSMTDEPKPERIVNIIDTSQFELKP